MTTTVSVSYAAWLKSPELTESAQSADAARWSTQGVAIAASSPFATEEGAAAEAARVLALMADPTVQDELLVVGRRSDLTGHCITGVGGGLDYDPAGESLYVLRARELADNTTALVVLRRLR